MKGATFILKEPTLILRSGDTLLGADADRAMQRRLLDVQNKVCENWLRAALKKAMGADAPRTDAELITEAVRQGYYCYRLIPPIGAHVILELQCQGAAVASVTVPAPKAVHPWGEL